MAHKFQCLHCKVSIADPVGFCSPYCRSVYYYNNEVIC